MSREPLEVREEARERRRLAEKPLNARVGRAERGCQRLLLFATPLEDSFEARRQERDDPVEAGEHISIVGRERSIHLASPREIWVLESLELIDRSCERSVGFGRKREAPALALKDFDQAIQREDSSSPFLADDHLERGRLLLLERKYTEALASFDAALKLRQDHSLAQRLRAEALFQLGRYEEFIEAFDRYLENGKPLESVYRGRGLARAELGRYPGAIEDYTKALETNPQDGEALINRGIAHLNLNDDDKAVADFDAALKLDPQDTTVCGHRAIAHLRKGRFDAAIDSARDGDRLCRVGRVVLSHSFGGKRQITQHQRRRIGLIVSQRQR